MITIIYYTDTIQPLVRALRSLHDTLQDASAREDEDVIDCLDPLYQSIRRKLNRLIKEGWRDEKWTPNELADDDRASLYKLMEAKVIKPAQPPF